MFLFYQVVSLAPVSNKILLSIRRNMNDDFEQSLISTRHNLDIARISVYLLKQEVYERMTPLHNLLLEMITRTRETRYRDPEIERLLWNGLDAKRRALAQMEDFHRLRVAEAQRCVDILRRQLVELERGEIPTIGA